MLQGLDIKENVNIKDYCTLQVGGRFRYFAIVKSVDDFKKLYKFAEEKSVKVFIFGGGSNMVFPDEVFQVLALKIEIFGFEVIRDEKEYMDIKVGAGENWDFFVERVVSMGLSGVEAMSAIPGTVGATPIQNVGAYGQEIKDTILSLEAFNKKDQNIKIFSKDECGFSYRNSIFKQNPPIGVQGEYIITYLIFRLSKSKPQIPDYPGIKEYFEERSINNPTIQDIRNAIIEIRKQKLPNPDNTPNVGSFFKNPIIKKSIAEDLKSRYESFRIFPIQDREDMVKVSAGWLIENAGLKGKSFGKVATYKNNALVLVNEGGATQEDIKKTRDQIIKIVQEKFGITLESEPEILE